MPEQSPSPAAESRGTIRRVADHGATKIVSVVVTAAVSAILANWQAHQDARAEAAKAKGSAEAGYQVTRESVGDLQALLQRTLLAQSRLEERVEAVEKALRARTTQRRVRGRVVDVRSGDIGMVAVQPPAAPAAPAPPKASDLLGEALGQGKLGE